MLAATPIYRYTKIFFISVAGQLATHKTAGSQAQRPLGNRYAGVPRNYVHVIALNLHTAASLAHRHFRLAGEDFGQHTDVFGVQMLHEDERHSVVLGKRMQKFGEGFQTSGGCAHTDDRKVIGSGRTGSWRGWTATGAHARRLNHAGAAVQ